MRKNVSIFLLVSSDKGSMKIRMPHRADYFKY